ncbi:MAG TPA: plasmid pRiA4b ORF-3 family protein [Planosporangium sp.]|nr:plasmid pRiA4b ORF-3 family protein [Planosporangium sp.]
MAKTRRTRRNHDHDPGPRADGGELPQLLEMLAVAGISEDEVLRGLDGPGGIEKMLQRLVDAGLLPSREESLAGLMAIWKPLLRSGCDPWSAELAGIEFLGMMREAASAEDEVPALLTGLISQAEEYPGPEALAMLRVLAVVGPVQARPVAAAAADRLVSAGYQDCPWVAGLGTPEVGACFGYTDGVGVQETLAVTFTYGRRQHALAVLIDHELGGGVKDCWPADHPDLIRSDYQRAAKRYGLSFHDYEPAEARAILDGALGKPVCPVAPDQVQDVHDYLDLLRSRAALLPRARNSARGRVRRSQTTTVYRVKVTLRGEKPPVWRRLEVPSGMTLYRLHRSIQAVFGWEDRDPWVFRTPAGAYGVAGHQLGYRSARSGKLADVAPRVRDLIYYGYDRWEHEILVEEVLAADPGVAYPRCVTGRRAHPSGTGGFDVDEANDALARLSRVLVKS